MKATEDKMSLSMEFILLDGRRRNNNRQADEMTDRLTLSVSNAVNIHYKK